MRDRFSLAIMGLAVAAILAFPASATGQAPTEDSVIAEGEGDLDLLMSFQIDARSGPSGKNPSGTATWHLGGSEGPTWEVDITCLSVTGNTAVIGFSGSVFGLVLESPTAGLIRVVDAGGPASGQDTFDFAEEQGDPFGEPVPGPTDCSSFPSTFPFVNGPIGHHKR